MDVRARILARPDLDDLRRARDLDGLAAALNAEGLMAPAPMTITARGVRALLPVVQASNFLRLTEQLSTATELPPAIAAVLKQAGVADEDLFAYLDTFASAHAWLQQEAGLDVGTDRAREMLDVIAASDPVKYGAAVAAIKAKALRPLVVTRDEIKVAMFNDDGTESE